MAEQEPGEIQFQTAGVLVDINEEVILSSMSNKLGARKRASEPRNQSCTIYKVADDIKKVDPGAFEPKVVSIGPFHRGNPKLLAVEGIKWQFLLDLIGRDPSNSLDKYIKAVSNPSFVQEIANCYSEQVIGADGVNAFVETLVLDGCFIIEFFLKTIEGSSMGDLDEGKRNHSLVISDLLMIENQIPFCVLQILFDSTSKVLLPSESGLPWSFTIILLHSLAFLSSYCLLKERRGHIVPALPEGIHHLLHLCHTYYVQSQTSVLQSWSVNRLIRYMIAWVSTELRCWREAPDKDFGAPRLIGSATELCKAGISFKRKRRQGCILDVTFRAIEGIMEIPPLSVSAFSVSELRNMVALEQLLPAVGNSFTSFAALMDIFVDTPADVDLLMKSGVLESKLNSPEEVAHFFNTLGKGAFLTSEEHYLKQLFRDVNEYCAEERHRWRASFMHTYFTNPWTAISLFAAVLLLLLTILQTFFAVFAYFRPP